MTSEPRRAVTAFELSDANGAVVQSGEAEAVIGDDGLSVGPVTVSFLDADGLEAANYRIQLDLWPGGRLTLSQLGRRFETFSDELRSIRNSARVVGLLAHGITSPAVFSGAVISDGRQRSSEIHVYDTHITIIPEGGDPWQLPLGSMSVVRAQDDPPAVTIDGRLGLTILGQLGRRRDAFAALVRERWETQRTLLAELTGTPGFSDGWGVAREAVDGFDELVDRFTAAERVSCRDTLLSAASGPARVGFVQLLDPDAESLASATPVPANWAVFLLVPVRAMTILEILAGPAAATYVFRGDIEAVNRDLQLMHFRRAPLALTAEQAALTPDNPHRLALRKLDPLQRLRSITTARLIHTTGWADSLRRAL